MYELLETLVVPAHLHTPSHLGFKDTDRDSEVKLGETIREDVAS